MGEAGVLRVRERVSSVELDLAGGLVVFSRGVVPGDLYVTVWGDDGLHADRTLMTGVDACGLVEGLADLAGVSL